MNDLQIKINKKRYQNTGTHVLENFQLNARPGEFVAIVGPSGSGKSTLLNIVAGLDEDFAGEITVNGQPLHEDHGPLEKIGFMFQQSRLMPWMTVLDNLLLVLGKDEKEAALALLSQVQLGDIQDHYPGQLSGGMQRRVALARAFAIQPDLLLMDEPFLSLDAPTAEYLRTILMQLWSDTRPVVLFVTHYLREALALADRVIFLSGAPARVVHELPIELPRPRVVEDDNVCRLHNELLKQHPELLSGLLTENPSAAKTRVEAVS